MLPDELLQECRKLSKTRSARPEGMAQPPPAEAISAACAPLKEYVLNECTGKLVSVVSMLPRSLGRSYFHVVYGLCTVESPCIHWHAVLSEIAAWLFFG